jgi:hypothetical protein
MTYRLAAAEILAIGADCPGDRSTDRSMDGTTERCHAAAAIRRRRPATPLGSRLILKGLKEREAVHTSSSQVHVC